jgi:KaiC/GvpD/RAD55 family RecA-like ATPase
VDASTSLSTKTLAVPLIDRLIPDGLNPATSVLVEFDPEGQWFAVSRTIVALAVKKGLRVAYGVTARPREELVASIAKLGIDVDAAERAGLLRIDDQYTCTLKLDKDNPDAVIVDDKYFRIGSPKIADWSIDQLKSIKGQGRLLSKWGSDQSGVLAMNDTFSPYLRFNEEKAFLEWMETRNLQLHRKLGRLPITAFSRGLHSESFYRNLEAMFDGLIEVRTVEQENEVKNLLRIRNLKGQPHDSHWHEISLTSAGEASLLT